MKKFILLVLFLVIISGCTLTPGKNNQPTEEAWVNKEKICANLTHVKSIVVNNNAIDIEFTPNGGFQVIGRKTESGIVESFEYATKFTVANGDNIYWGDGDHAVNYLTVTDIKDSVAYINFRDEFYWDGKTTGNTQNCIIKNRFPE
jgi:hypothetical protein